MRLDSNKRFVYIVLVVLIIWIIGWNLISHSRNQMGKSHEEIKILKDKIHAFLTEISFPQEEENLEEENRQIQRKIQTLSDSIHYPAKGLANSSILEFRSECEQKLRSLKQQSNRLGIGMEDTSMGFHQLTADKIGETHWVHLQLGYEVVEHVLQIGDRENLKSVVKIDYPLLETATASSASTDDVFIQNLRIQLSLECTFSFLMKLLHNFCRSPEERGIQSASNPENGKIPPFLTVSAATITETDSSSVSKMLKAQLTFTAFKINPASVIKQKRERQDSGNSSKVPLWEKY